MTPPGGHSEHSPHVGQVITPFQVPSERIRLSLMHPEPPDPESIPSSLLFKEAITDKRN